MSTSTTNKTTTKTNADDETKLNERTFFLKVLDDLVSLNTLFTSAVFMGISFATTDQHSLEQRQECDADVSAAKRLVFFEISSFSFFLLSGLLAKTNKFFLYIYQNQAHINPRESRFCMYLLYLSAYGTTFGVGFLIASMVEIVQIRVGALSCGTPYGIAAVSVLCVLVVPAVLTYFLSVSYHLVTFDIPRAVRKKKPGALTHVSANNP